MDAIRNARILVVDDQDEIMEAVEAVFPNDDAHPLIVKAASAETALEMVAIEAPDLVITGRDMPELDGIQLLRRLRIEPETREIPVIVCSCEATGPEDLQTALKAGAVDFVGRPIEPAELMARSHSMLHLGASLKTIKEQKTSLQDAYQKMEDMARTDPLTKLPNRKGFLEILEHERAVSDRTSRPFVLAIGDIDRFKKVNDRFGHTCGDRVLVSVAELIQKKIRKQDYVGRWGGEEFILLFPDTDLRGGQVIEEKIRQAVAGREFRCQDQSVSISMTLGCCVYDGPEDLDICLKRADMDLCREKRSGRNSA